MLTKVTTLCIVDDHLIVLEGLQKLLANVKDIQISGCFTTGAATLAHLQTNPVDILLLDISLPDINGIELCKEIKILSPATRILALSNHSERSLILQMLQNGASGYLLKNVSGEELVACIQEALGGLVTFSKAVKEIMARPSMTELKGTPQLTKREKEILLLVSEGKTTLDIAQLLNLSPLTVETHRKNLIQKFQAPNMAAVVKAATQQGLV
ncbi:response regulator transcription factor [Chitinophaga nivalis]|uniref:Response regulator transcription factor n=1 Tax=Chitinophaga nivalis TaxID=2991709 RepID=A0ABT3IKI1_9BACT|nr:response regulator transcription factor [Chitinophaga nivalis]MCW3465838.1 response regulator transcription factor [Chitinophaga nivalis]MCW3484471.1 response regulator transcription factor [Chitinophaga nivalis]